MVAEAQVNRGFTDTCQVCTGYIRTMYGLSAGLQKQGSQNRPNDACYCRDSQIGPRLLQTAIWWDWRPLLLGGSGYFYLGFNSNSTYKPGITWLFLLGAFYMPQFWSQLFISTLKEPFKGTPVLYREDPKGSSLDLGVRQATAQDLEVEAT